MEGFANEIHRNDGIKYRKVLSKVRQAIMEIQKLKRLGLFLQTLFSDMLVG